MGVLKAQTLAQAGVLYAPASFLLATEEELTSTCNGCGAANSWFRPPSTIYGTCITPACNIHDWMYSQGRVMEDKEEADRTMLNNMLRLIQQDSHKWWKPSFLQRQRAKEYYEAVVHFGGVAFWAGKN